MQPDDSAFVGVGDEVGLEPDEGPADELDGVVDLAGYSTC
jgi:hypothetical protein